MPRQAIITRYVGPTDRKGSRIIARCDAGRAVVECDPALSQEDNHRAAAHALMSRFGWDRPPYGRWHMGGLPAGGYVFVQEEP